MVFSAQMGRTTCCHCQISVSGTVDKILCLEAEHTRLSRKIQRRHAVSCLLRTAEICVQQYLDPLADNKAVQCDFQKLFLNTVVTARAESTGFGKQTGELGKQAAAQRKGLAVHSRAVGHKGHNEIDRGGSA